jgi:hypothetical protein
MMMRQAAKDYKERRSVMGTLIKRLALEDGGTSLARAFLYALLTGAAENLGATTLPWLRLKAVISLPSHEGN